MTHTHSVIPAKAGIHFDFRSADEKRQWITVRSCGLPFGPFALRRMFASAYCLRSPAFAGMTI